jgi:hypothetical protein
VAQFNIGAAATPGAQKILPRATDSTPNEKILFVTRCLLVFDFFCLFLIPDASTAAMASIPRKPVFSPAYLFMMFSQLKALAPSGQQVVVQAQDQFREKRCYLY